LKRRKGQKMLFMMKACRGCPSFETPRERAASSA
jgi:hypothetical protein